ncbi:hypothetical protein LI82_08045 [Methanococcoides methylutens]|uniref:SD-repeat containing protein B domain-containing protein n=2 Tax=Methanococcoides methylutens TaxID=2226 RepID=A0A099SXU6_METMT|nr:hypothetical protein LI82_08045 [Methanococcoides methylutens]
MSAGTAVAPTVTCTDVGIGDLVWEDLDGDGIKNAGEPGIAGVTVKLYECGATNPIATTTTDANGMYLFTGLAPGDYYVEFVAPVGYIFTPPDQGADDAMDSDADPTTGKTVCTNLESGETDLTWDAGMLGTTGIGDLVWEDLDRDGIKDTGEPGIASVTVELYECGGNAPIATTTTSSTGMYLFTGLAPSDYHVEFVAPAGYIFTPQDQGADDAMDSDADPTTGKTVCTNLGSGETDLTWDAGFYMIVTKINIDIKPGSFPNSINPNSKGVIPVAILSTDVFDATMVDPVTVVFGPNDVSPLRWATEDVDKDGDLDLVFHFRTQETGVEAGDTEATLTGETFDGTNIEGTDSVKIVPS